MTKAQSDILFYYANEYIIARTRRITASALTSEVETTEDIVNTQEYLDAQVERTERELINVVVDTIF